MKYIRLWLDDERDPSKYGCIGWYWAKTSAEAIDILKDPNIAVLEMSLDHDLGVFNTIGIPGYIEDTGMKVVEWMEENLFYPSQGCCIHSQNPVGKRRMQMALVRLEERLLTNTNN